MMSFVVSRIKTNIIKVIGIAKVLGWTFEIIEK